jgi:DNA-binding CsgD family transcriptional regulator
MIEHAGRNIISQHERAGAAQPRRTGMRQGVFLVLVFVLQLLCALYFVSDIVFSVLGIYIAPLPWGTREGLEIAAALGLLLGLGLSAQVLLRLLREHRDAQEKLRRASGAFMALLAERFRDWNLTAAERDVAMFAIKGLSSAEIAALRATSEGTVKAQSNAIYRKAGVNGRGQLLSLVIEDLMEDAHLPEPRAPQATEPELSRSA